MDSAEHNKSRLTCSATFAEASSSARSRNLLDFVSDNIAAPLGNAALIEPFNALASSINEASASLGGGKLLSEKERFESPKVAVLSKEWVAQSLSTGIGTILPLCASIAVTRGGMLRLAGQGESMTANFLRNRITHTVLGATMYDALRKPHEGETRYGNALGGASGFLVFEAGNYLSRNLSPMGKVGARALTGALGASAHITVSELASHGKLPELRKLQDGALAGSAMNIVMPWALNKMLSAAPTKLTENVTQSAGAITNTSALSAEATAEATTAAVRRGASSNRFYLPEPRLVDAHGRPLRLSEDPTVPPVKSIPTESLYTCGAVSEGSIYEFGQRVSAAIERFRQAPSFEQNREAYRAIGRRYGDVSDSAADLIDRVNVTRKLQDHFALRDLGSAELSAALEAQPRLQAWHREVVRQRKAVGTDAHELFSSGDFRRASRDLRNAVMFLGDEMGIPRLGFGIRRLAGNTHASYTSGVGKQYLQARALFKENPVEVAATVGHETAHGLQDYIVMSSLADRLSLRLGAPCAVATLQRECQAVCGYTPTPKWTKAVLAMRDGSKLTDEQVAFANNLLADAADDGARTKLHQNVLKAINYMDNPHAKNAVSSLFAQIRDGSLKSSDILAPSPPQQILALQRAAHSMRPVDSAANREAMAIYFEDIAKKLEGVRFAKYRMAYHERDAWGFEGKVRETVRSPQNKWDFYGLDGEEIPLGI